MISKKILVLLISIFSQVASDEERGKIALINDPKYKKYIDKLTQQMKELEELSLDEQRKLDEHISLDEITFSEEVKRIENMEVIGFDNNPIPIRFYYPSEKNDLPILVFFHGGGWVFGSIARADALCRRLANHLHCIVASVEYRLAPENPFPKPLDDCYAATCWIGQNFANKIIVGGESAGGNLAAATALLAKERNRPYLNAQLLINPVITSTIKSEPYENCQDRYFLTKDLMKYFWNMYLQSPEDEENSLASPEKAKDLSNLPPALIITAEHDPLRLEAELYAKKLKEAKVPVIEKNFSNVIHGFLAISLYEEQQKAAWSDEIYKLLRKMSIF